MSGLRRAWHGDIPFFSEEELACKGSGIIALDYRFVAELLVFRVAFDHPMTPTSVCRSPGHNATVNGHPRSLHLTTPYHTGAAGTMALDVSTVGWDGSLQRKAVNIARERRWSIGFAATFLHFDRRVDLGMPRAEFDY